MLNIKYKRFSCFSPFQIYDMKVKVVVCLVKSCHERVFDFIQKRNENIEFFSKLLPMGNGIFLVTKLP